MYYVYIIIYILEILIFLGVNILFNLKCVYLFPKYKKILCLF